MTFLDENFYIKLTLKKFSIKVTLSISLCLAVLCIPTFATAQTGAGLQITGLYAENPVAQGQNYRLFVQLSIQNRNPQPSPDLLLRLTYTTATGQQITLENETLPALYHHKPEEIRLAPIPAASTIDLRGFVLLPLTWYRGAGRLEASLFTCQAQRPNCQFLARQDIPLSLY
ncbi:hypothetical protein [Candidatus Venteria ishoeyi]|uniref:Telomeric repeat-binding factor 2 n=1 Tax=Candidatus Venteria ishoeyi TaxID=1899563 RepID=A0A1H6F451_9GAMM|nr:hypothetical protein [Candidatus Venteria ishoeyi]SEH04343.1 Uncharacterised protein [Candidatus Venteria ishoeyi]